MSEQFFSSSFLLDSWEKTVSFYESWSDLVNGDNLVMIPGVGPVLSYHRQIGCDLFSAKATIQQKHDDCFHHLFVNPLLTMTETCLTCNRSVAIGDPAFLPLQSRLCSRFSFEIHRWAVAAKPKISFHLILVGLERGSQWKWMILHSIYRAV